MSTTTQTPPATAADAALSYPVELLSFSHGEAQDEISVLLDALASDET